MSDELTNFSILTKGLQSALAHQEIEDGRLRFTTDTGRLYLDIKEEGTAGERILISETVNLYTEYQIFNEILAPLPKIYVASDTHRAYVSNGIQWFDLAAVKLAATVAENSNKVIWFSETTDEQPVYDADFHYNPNSQLLTVPNLKATIGYIGNMRIQNTLNADETSHTVTIDFI